MRTAVLSLALFLFLSPAKVYPFVVVSTLEQCPSERIKEDFCLRHMVREKDESVEKIADFYSMPGMEMRPDFISALSGNQHFLARNPSWKLEPGDRVVIPLIDEAVAELIKAQEEEEEALRRYEERSEQMRKILNRILALAALFLFIGFAGVLYIFWRLWMLFARQIQRRIQRFATHKNGA